jgi:Zn-dependent protease with chaperone function
MQPAAGLFEPEQVERARRYRRPLYLGALAATTLDLTLLALLTFGALGDRLYAIADGWPFAARAVCFSLLVLTLLALVDLPVGFWAGYLHEHAWSLSAQTAGGWLVDRLKGLAINRCLGMCALLGFVACAHAWPTAWPAIVAVAAAGCVLALTFVSPLILEPLFNRFEALPDPKLAADLIALADQAGLPVDRVLVVDASRRTRKLNAYVSGLGHSRRIVLYDTLVTHANPLELRLVVAHELGHRRHRHIAKGTLLGAVGVAVFVFTAWVLLRWPALRSTLGVTGPGDPRVIPFLLLLGSVLGLLASPFWSAVSRRWERQADAFSLSLTRDPDTFETTHRRLALDNLADLDPPRPAYLVWYSHPTPAERITAGRKQQPPATIRTSTHATAAPPRRVEHSSPSQDAQTPGDAPALRDVLG